jgi:hypothetical protein
MDEREAKRRRTAPEEVEEDADEEDDFDARHPPHVGHVSMLTDFVLTSFTSTALEKPPMYIITSDRDEHIRISRWGKRRAGHLALRYLLGSTEAVGGLCVVEHQLLKALNDKVTTESAKDLCKYPLLLSSESSRLRIWSLHKDDQVSSRRNCLLVVDLLDGIAPFLKVNAKREQKREKSFGKGKLLTKKKAEFLGEDKEPIDTTVSPAIVMFHLSIRQIKDEVYLSFVVDGASALFTIALSKLLTSPQDAFGTYLHALDMGAPILSHVFQTSEEESRVWITCDTRPDVVGEQINLPSLRMAKWSDEQQQWIEEEQDKNPLLANQDQFRSAGSQEISDSLLCYDALILYPKQEFETTVLMENAVAPNGLIRGGITNFERGGKARGTTSTANKGNSERMTGKKVKAREDMLKRIEQALGEAEGVPLLPGGVTDGDADLSTDSGKPGVEEA